ncbi:MAG: cytochrome c oxidase assembly protein [Pseudomonadota bacterium]
MSQKPNVVVTKGLEKAKTRTLKKLLVICLVMFAFGFAMIPFYKKICEVTGVNLLGQPDITSASPSKISAIDNQRLVLLQFDANQREGWQFKPVTSQQMVHPGALIKAEFIAKNLTGSRVKAQAIPSYSPAYSQQFFQKLECFCFRQQMFEPYEEKRLPVILRLDPALPKEAKTLTLSYTLFRVEGA